MITSIYIAQSCFLKTNFSHTCYS